MSASHRNTVHLFAGDDARIERVIERGPFYAYDRCEDCGAEPRTTCMRPDNTPAVEVCGDRRLLLPGGMLDDDGRTTRNNNFCLDVKHGPCRGCGATVRLLRRFYEEGSGWCQAEVCQQARRREDWERRKIRERKARV